MLVVLSGNKRNDHFEKNRVLRLLLIKESNFPAVIVGKETALLGGVHIRPTEEKNSNDWQKKKNCFIAGLIPVGPFGIGSIGLIDRPQFQIVDCLEMNASIKKIFLII